MTLKELFSEWGDLHQLYKGGLLASVAIVGFTGMAYAGKSYALLGIGFLGILLTIIFLCAMNITNKE